MNGWQAWLLVWTAVPLIVGWLFLGVPSITRRGLVFGIYFGEDPGAADAARRLRRAYKRDILLVTGAIAGIGIALLLPLWSTLAAQSTKLATLIGVPVCLGTLFAGTQACCQRARRAAARLVTPQTSTPPAVAYLTGTASGLAFPIFATLVAIGAGLFCLLYVWWHVDALPERWALRVTVMGEPCGWVERWVATVVWPLTFMLLPGWLGAYACLLARAKVAVRVGDHGVSLRAQERFRTAQTRFFSGLSLLATVLFGLVSLKAIAVGLGRQPTLSTPLPVLAAATFVLYVVAGVVYIGVRYGQGGARLETSAVQAPLADGLADNRKWKFGFYINRDDPAWFVEERFGWGYEPNLGNPWAVAFYAGGIILIVLMCVLGCWGMWE